MKEEIQFLKQVLENERAGVPRPYFPNAFNPVEGKFLAEGDVVLVRKNASDPSTWFYLILESGINKLIDGYCKLAQQ